MTALNKNQVQIEEIEQTLHHFLMQKQQLQSQLLEVENAFEETTKTKDQVYQIVGPIMIQKEKESIIKDLKTRKEVLEVRVQNIEKQVQQLKDKVASMKKEVQLNENGTKTKS